MPSIDAVASQILGAGVPVLFLDTCILLDVIRSTSRCLPHYTERASALLTRATSAPPDCLIIISSIVPQEWRAHAQGVTDEVNRHLAKMQEQSSHLHDACDVLGIDPDFGRASYESLGLAERLRDLAGQLLNAAIGLDADDVSKAKAGDRIINKIPPSRKGGEFKDCVILEESLAVCQRLQAAGFERKRVYCTSNTDDYCESKRLHPALAVEFAAVGLTFTTNLPWAVSEIAR